MNLWSRFNKYYCVCDSLGIGVDISMMGFPDDFFEETEPRAQTALADMAKLEAGGIANPDENRMVGHYWLRTPERCPEEGARRDILSNIDDVTNFARDVLEGKVRPDVKDRFQSALLIGIGGSSLGSQMVHRALFEDAGLDVRFMDNTDPEGMESLLGRIDLASTLTVTISKSGGTRETRNGMLETARAYERSGLRFASHAVAITGLGSELEELAKSENWLRRFPFWDWVGGRTSAFSAAGLLPAALAGIDIRRFLEGASLMDKETRRTETLRNPAVLLALMWFFAGDGKGGRDLVILPYKDRLELTGRYLQQLIMESLGKELDLDGNIARQGLTVYGNKGSTDQHAFVQQLRDGPDDFFVTFIEVLKDRENRPLEVEPGLTAGDYLQGFLLGTRKALHENGRGSITITLPDTDARSVGALIALFERAVGLYASMIHINAYHQPGVEAGKKAAASFLETRKKAVEFLRKSRRGMTAEAIAKEIDAVDRTTAVFKTLDRLSRNRFSSIIKVSGGRPDETVFRFHSV